MLSWRTARHISGLSVAALLVVGALMPSTANAAGSEITGGTPGVVETQAPAKVSQQEIPTRPAAERAAPHVEESHEGHEHEGAAADHVVAELTRTDLKPFSMLGVTWTKGLADDETVVEVRWREVGEAARTWSSWTELHVDPAPGEGGIPGTEPQWVDRADAAEVRVLSTAGAKPEGLSLSTIDPRTSTSSTTASSAEADPGPGIVTAAATTVAKPAIISRASWGASNSGSCDSPIYGKTTRGAVIHHTAGSNTYTKAQSAGIVKATQAYHKGSRDWCDIGYNFLVDKYGQIFEGRAGGTTKPVRAAHSGNAAVNEETMGVSLMGTFTSSTPSAEMKTAVVNLVAWRFDDYNLPGKGTYSLGGKSLNRIAGHRNVVGTECPGAKAYAWLAESGGLRDRVVSKLAGQPAAKEISGRGVSSVTNTGFNLSWTAVSGARSYQVVLSTSSKTPTTCSTGCRTVSPTTTPPKYAARNLSAGRTYYAWVRAISPAGKAMTVWQSKPATAKLTASPSTPGTTNPVPKEVGGRAVFAVTSTGFNLSWTAVAGARSYQVRLSTSSKAPTTCSTGCKTVSPSSTPPTYAARNLSAGRTYYAWVRAISSTGKALTVWQATPKTAKLTAPASTQDSVTVPSSRKVAVKGHGYGHGIGMSQYGAQNAASRGATYAGILSRYYPGTKLGTKTGSIRVLISQDTTDAVTIAGGSGLVFRDVKARKTLKLPTTISGKTVTRWQITQSADKKQSTLQYRTNGSYFTYKSTRWTGDGQFEGPSTIQLMMGSSGVKYRGAVRSAVPSSGSTKRDTVNVVAIEDYVRGVIAAEMPSSWKAQALNAQAVAARTYGVRTIKSSGYYDICSTTSCQVYGGASRETTSTNAAVKATAGRIVTYEGKPAFTQFSSSSGGYSAPGSQPYLKAVSDPYDNWSGNANHAWSTTVTAATIEKAYPSIGTLKQLKVTKRNGHGDWNGRVTSLSVVGSKKTETITGDNARWAFGLKSNWFRF